MSDTIGGGLKVSGILSRAERLLKSDNVLRDDFDQTVLMVRTIRDNPLASDKERLKAAEILIGVMARGDKLASELAAEERIDGGKLADRKEVVIKIKFDDAG
jgi:hypothetical protein